MLLQIHEPGDILSPKKEEDIAIGIDLGTTNSVIGLSRHQKPFVLKKDSPDSGIIPSVVAYCEDRTLVGQEALSIPESFVVKSVKRLMGKGFKTVQDTLENKTFDFVPDQNPEDVLKFRVQNKILTPIDVSADILRFLKERAELILGHPVHKAVITVPAYFSESARVATRNAAQLAGLETLRLLSEPTAAAVAYGLDNHNDGIYAIYDLGGGTFDFSLLRFEKGVFQVLATGGDTNLGGDDLDYLLAKEIAIRLGRTVENLTDSNFKCLLGFARFIKEDLSSKKVGIWPIPDALKSITTQIKEVSFTLGDLDTLFDPPLNTTLKIAADVLKDAGVPVSTVDQVILVGGSTISPSVQKKVHGFFGKEPLCSINPEEVVALGAAIQAEALTQGSTHLLLDVTPLSLGIETMGGVVEKIIFRNTPLPASHTQEFTTHQDNQRAMAIHVLQGESDKVTECRSLGRFTLTDIPPMPAGLARIAITYTLDADGLLSVTATEKTTGISQHVEIKPSYGLDMDEMARLLGVR